jgi:hypothetical protein
LEGCQAESATGKLKLMVKRGGETIDVELDIGKKYGSYAATYPAACPKSEKILGELLDYISKQQEENGSFGKLSAIPTCPHCLYCRPCSRSTRFNGSWCPLIPVRFDQG